MSDISKRAVDPQTGQPFPYAPNGLIRLLAWLGSTGWGKKHISVLILSAGTFVTGWMMAHNGTNGADTVGAGVVSFLTYLYYTAASWLTHHYRLEKDVTDFALPPADPPAVPYEDFAPAPVPVEPRPSQLRARPLMLSEALSAGDGQYGVEFGEYYKG